MSCAFNGNVLEGAGRTAWGGRYAAPPGARPRWRFSRLPQPPGSDRAAAWFELRSERQQSELCRRSLGGGQVALLHAVPVNQVLHETAGKVGARRAQGVSRRAT